ncbi:MAG: cell division protein FtsA [Verrucomicrobia bacterium]|nr:cell division protein FtsA [Verrucomicrobiota bacterium]MBU4248588.1 cell division protein FtsA [Verrucomicrobiota bacterium]MBU4290528.1 cell division protein FtsA [Verrucomicrobiota bacterium]MBU4429141.1 cell division protein FtsA [Verrucomicrobiota bacterium]MCG2680707.1 cell division protein FtsA [Kiritimatiellia bacterium]
MAVAPVVALEMGTSKVCALVGEAREDGNIMITGIGLCPSCGVRKGIIVDLEKVASCVRTAIQGAEQSGAVEIRQVNITLSGSHLQSVINPGSVPVFDAQRGITRDDIEEVMNIAKAIHLPHDVDILHTIPQTYTVDDQGGVINPEGMQGGKLSLDMLILHCSRNQLNNAVKAVQNVGLEVVDVAFSGLCSALAALTPEQKECGVALIDLGGGTTSYVVYAGGIIATAGVLAVGGDHITNDIAVGFSISLKRAEILKQESGSAIVDASTHFQRISVPQEVGFSACSVAISDLNAVIHARVDETFQMMRHDFDKKRLMRQLGAGLVLTGGGAHLRGVETVAERVFEMPCAMGRPKNFSGVSTVHEGPEYASLLGMVRYAIRSGSQAEETVSLGGFFKRWFGRGG